jgi:hypothetical protein
VHEISEAERVELDALLARYERLTGVVVDEQQRAALKKVVSPEYLKALAAA